MGWKIAAVSSTLAAAFLVFIISSSKAQGQNHFEVQEFAKKNQSLYNGTRLTLYGNVKEGSKKLKPNGIAATFTIFKEGHEILVSYIGEKPLPDTLKDGSIATVEGKYNHSKNILVATKVSAKCASKYSSAAADQAADQYKDKYR